MRGRSGGRRGRRWGRGSGRRWLATHCVVWIGLSLPISHAEPAPERDFTIVIFGDTQKLVRANADPPSRRPPIEAERLARFASMIDWVIEQRERESIELVLHVGDAINAGVFGVETPGSQEEWARFNAQWRRLDGVVPYLLARGNHDDRVEFVRHYGARHFTRLAERLSQLERLASSPAQDAHVLRVDLGGQPTLVLSVSCYPPPEEMALLEQQLRAHAELPAVVVSHIITSGPGQHPASTSKSDPDCSGPEPPVNVWKDLIVPHARQVVLTASGHFIHRVPALSSSKVIEPIGSARVLDTYQNFQELSSRPAGYALTLVRVRASDGTVSVETFSPVDGARRGSPAALTGEGRLSLSPRPFAFEVGPPAEPVR